MNKKQRKIYDAIFATPIRRNIIWDDVVSLVEALGGTIIQGNGSRVRFSLNNISLNIHLFFGLETLGFTDERKVRLQC